MISEKSHHQAQNICQNLNGNGRGKNTDAEVWLIINTMFEYRMTSQKAITEPWFIFVIAQKIELGKLVEK